MAVQGSWEGVGVSVSRGQSLSVGGWKVLDGGGCATV